MSAKNRRDWQLGPLHIIKRRSPTSQYGLLTWGYEAITDTRWTISLFLHRQILTARWNRG